MPQAKSVVKTGSVKDTWPAELDKVAMKFHLIGCWVAIIVNPIWIISDYFTVPEKWQFWAVLRVLASLLTLATVLLRKKLKLSPEFIIYVPAMSLSILSAYMLMVVDVEIFRMTTLGYCTLFIGMGMLILWRIIHSFIAIGLSLVANVIFYILLSPLTVEEVITNGGFVTISVALFTIILIQSRYVLTKKEIIARLALTESKATIQEKNERITNSILYAKRIQEAILPAREELEALFGEYFVFYKPRDIVSGDFYWACQAGDNKIVWASADCTGHGVPGALMSMIGISLLNEIVLQHKTIKANEILDQLRQQLIESLSSKEKVLQKIRQEGPANKLTDQPSTGSEAKGLRSALEERSVKLFQNNLKDGMDIALCVWDRSTNTLEYAGAYNPLYLIRGEELMVTKADKQPIGIYTRPKPFTSHTIRLEPNDLIFTFSDGFPDQFGGDRKKKYTQKQFRELLYAGRKQTMKAQEKTLIETFDNWKGRNDQVDDICIFGVKVT